MRGCTACRRHQGRASKSRSGWRVTILGKAARQRATRRCLSVRNGGDTAEDGKPWDQSLPTVVRKAGTGLMLGRPPADFVAANPTPGQMLRLGPDAKGRLRRALTFKARNDHRLPPQGRGDRSSYAFTQGLTTEQIIWKELSYDGSETGNSRGLVGFVWDSAGNHHGDLSLVPAADFATPEWRFIADLLQPVSSQGFSQSSPPMGGKGDQPGQPIHRPAEGHADQRIRCW